MKNDQTEVVTALERWREEMPCYLSVQDRELRIIDTNKLFRRDFGDKIGEYCFKAYKNNQAPCPTCPVLQTFEDGQVHTSEETVLSGDGKRLDVVVTSTPLFDEHGEISSVMEMSTNVTEIKTLRRELKQTRQDYKRLFEAVPGYICVLDRDLQILEANTLYLRDFDIKRGKHCYKVCKMRDEKCPECLVEKTFQDGQMYSSEESLTTRDGRELELVVYSMPIKDVSGEIFAVMEVFTDITEVKRLQRKLTLMGRAVAGMAHRIKNILMGLEGGIFVVNTGIETDDRASMSEGWEMVERNVGKVSRLVKDLLFCSKEHQPNFKDDVCPHDVALEVHSTYVKRSSDEGIDLRLDLTGPSDCGRFDADGLHNLMANLVTNAIDACRFNPDQGKTRHTITLRCGRDPDGSVVIEVQDDGPGIPEDVREKVFESFFSTKGTEGTGIGLLVVQKVAQEHEGNVTFTTEAGKGTTFRVTIPNPGGRLQPVDSE